MTIQDMITKADDVDILILMIIFLFPPVLAWITGLCHPRGHGNIRPWNYIYSILVYIVCIPGMFSCVLTGYAMFFIQQNILQVNPVIYFLPVVSMIITLVFVGKNADRNQLPGVDRLYGLMIIITASFSIALAVHKTRIWIFFGGTIGTLIIIALLCFALLKWASYMLFRSKYRFEDTQPVCKNTKTISGKKELEKLKKKMGMK